MNRKSFLFLLIFLSSTSFASPAPVSAIRLENESFEDAFHRNKSLQPFSHFKSDLSDPFEGTASDVAVPLKEVDFSEVPVWKNKSQALKAFLKLRDERFLEMEGKPDFERRITWLYPDDGCFARAEFMRQKLEEWKFPATARIFVFGNLTVDTPNAVNGRVRWWVHTAPILRLRSGAVVVLDPSIEPTKPLDIRDWLSRQSSDLDVSIAVCRTDTYSPYDFCNEPNEDVESRAELDESGFLKQEWRRMQLLGRDPKKVLGDAPPWLKP
jgi:hypothetical protein